MRKHRVVIVGFYALLALLALYNPIFHLGTHVTGWPVTDFYHFHWNYWWLRHALASGLNVYLTDYVFAPFTNNLAFHTLTPFFYPIWALLEPFVGTVAAMTAIFVVAMTASAGAFYALLRREGVSVGLALVGGAMLELTPLMLTGVYWTNINLMGWFWLPLLLLLWGEMAVIVAPDRFVESGLGQTKLLTSPPALSTPYTSSPTVSPPLHVVERGQGCEVRLALYTLLLGVSFWAMVLTDLQYPLWNAFVVVPYALFTLWRAGSARARLQCWLALRCSGSPARCPMSSASTGAIFRPRLPTAPSASRFRLASSGTTTRMPRATFPPARCCCRWLAFRYCSHG